MRNMLYFYTVFIDFVKLTKKKRRIMKTNRLKWMALLMVVAVLIGSCNKEDDTIPNNNINPPVASKNNYLASGSYGDIITYEIDVSNKTYSYINETTGQSGNGTFSTSSNINFNGVYEITIGGDMFYAVELAEKVFVTSLPSGRADNKLCFGISSDLDLLNDYTMSDLSGKYIYVNYDNITRWGGYEIKSDGTYTRKQGPDDETTFEEATGFSGTGTGAEAGSGTWEILSSSNSTRVIFTDTEEGTESIGTIYPGKVLLIDHGVGCGFSVGVKYPNTHSTQSSIAGTYRFLDVDLENNESGLGYYTLPAAGGNVDGLFKYSDYEGSISASNFAPVSAVNNMFKMSNEYEDITVTTLMVILPGEVMLHFNANSAGSINHGAGAKIN